MPFWRGLPAIVGSTGTVLLIVHSLSPEEQGYYYTLLSLVSLQIVFELGFCFVIQQLAAHECVHLELHPDGKVTGDPIARARLAAALQLSVRWYTHGCPGKWRSCSPHWGSFFFSALFGPRPNPDRLAGSVDRCCAGQFSQFVVHAVLFLS